jgi:hypothetical protein
LAQLPHGLTRALIGLVDGQRRFHDQTPARRDSKQPPSSRATVRAGVIANAWLERDGSLA